MSRVRSGSVPLAAIALLWLLLTSAQAAGSGSNTWSGTWHTSWTGGVNSSADMILTQSGSTVTGTYNHLAGALQGTVSGNTLTGQWTQSNDHGTVTFTLGPDGKSWSGTWTGGKGGTWAGTCAAGACLGNTIPPSATAKPGQRPSATVVQCNRDVNTTANALYHCTALVTDDEAPSHPPQPTGKVTWTASVGSFSGASCVLVLPDVGVPSCSVDFNASNQDIPNQIAQAPVTAAYSGDSVYAPSQGSPHLGPGPAAAPTNTGTPPWVYLAAGAGGLGAAALAYWLWAQAHAGGAAGAALVDPGSPKTKTGKGGPKAGMSLDDLHRAMANVSWTNPKTGEQMTGFPATKAGGVNPKAGGVNPKTGTSGDPPVNPKTGEPWTPIGIGMGTGPFPIDPTGGKHGNPKSKGSNMSPQDSEALNRLLEQFGGDGLPGT